MNLVLTAINAKYIHSNLAVYSLKAYAKEYAEHIQIAEYTINQQTDEVLAELYRKKPDVLCLSCYIWNITFVKQITREIHKLLPEMPIWLGGPEVSFDAMRVLEKMPEVTGVIFGEGEETFLELVRHYVEHVPERLVQIRGIAYRDEYGYVCRNQEREVLDLSSVPFVYDQMKDFEHKIIYYETSRGCPFSCSYCLSSVDKRLRFRNLNLVKRELQFFLDQKVPQVKFVDRTFNCRHDLAMAIWSYIYEHDNGITNFHFEVAADLLDEEEIALITRMRPGLIQLEIGVQSTNPETISEIRRKMDFAKVADRVRRINEAGNIHQHLDLIAGLPQEDYASFRKSFNDVYALRPEQLQLGFLKVLKGSYMAEKSKEYGLVYKSEPPYEVLYTKWLPYEDVRKLKGVEEMVEVYYNSGQFRHTLDVLEEAFPDAFSMYEALSSYYEKEGLYLLNHTRVARYEILYAFATEQDAARSEIYRELLTYDLYLRENMKNRPDFAGEMTVAKEELQQFYDAEEQDHRILKSYEQYDRRQLRKMTHVERFSFDVTGSGKTGVCTLLFDYQNRNPLNRQATVYDIHGMLAKTGQTV